jgi:hypothetical protein
VAAQLALGFGPTAASRKEFLGQTLSVIGDVDAAGIDNLCVTLSFPADGAIMSGAKPHRSGD